MWLQCSSHINSIAFRCEIIGHKYPKDIFSQQRGRLCKCLKYLLQAQLKLAEHLRKLGEQGKDVEGMDVDLDQLRGNLAKYRKYGFTDDLDWLDDKKKVKAITIFFYETSV